MIRSTFVMTENVTVVTHDNIAEVVLSGNATLYDRLFDAGQVIEQIRQYDDIVKVVFRADRLVTWDSSVVTFISNVVKYCKQYNIVADLELLPVGMQRLLALSQAKTPRRNLSVKSNDTALLVVLVGLLRLFVTQFKQGVSFTGEVCISIFRFCRVKTSIRWQEFGTILQEVGVRAFPIVALISFLVGLIISFISLLQLEQFGASIYVADLVGIAMMREMGCIMTGVIMSGRTGAAFAATIGTMTVNDEVDALKTSGFSTIDFLVLPRILALTLMMPILCIFADVIGITGGICAALTMTDITLSQYITQTVAAISLGDMFVGLLKSGVFGVLISSIGCFRGMQCGRSAESVGLVTTSAVVTGITAIIIADATFAVLFSCLGI